jgi:hypothetical protein
MPFPGAWFPGPWTLPARALTVAALALAALAAGGCNKGSPPGCHVSSDCATGVCRGGNCSNVPCNAMMACQSNEKCVNGACTPQGQSQPCKMTSDCPKGSGVCRQGLCINVPCTPMQPCLNGETCVMGQCGAAMAGGGTPGHTLAAGGAVSTSGKHIHIGLTGQGRAVGPGASPSHQHITGATAVMGR